MKMCMKRLIGMVYVTYPKCVYTVVAGKLLRAVQSLCADSMECVRLEMDVSE